MIAPPDHPSSRRAEPTPAFAEPPEDPAQGTPLELPTEGRTVAALARPVEVLRRASEVGKTARFSFHTPAGAADVWVRKGHLVDAVLGRVRGERALLQLVSYGAARWTEQSEQDSVRQSVNLDVRELEQKAEARQRQWVELLEALPPLSAVLVPTPLDAPLEGARARIYSLIDGERPLFGVLDESGIDPVATLSCVRQLLDAGAVSLGGPSRSPRPSAPTLPPEEEDRAFDALHDALTEAQRTSRALGAGDLTRGEVLEEPAGGRFTEATKEPEATTDGDAPASSRPFRGDAGRDSGGDAGEEDDGRERPLLGRYEILGRLGRGGMATVYLCRLRGEGGFSRRFALKVLRKHLCRSPDAVQLLLREARLTGKLHHPNVVSVVDVGNDGGQPYLVMEYVPGCSVAELLAAEARGELLITPAVAAAIGVEALSGLHAAHTLGDERGRPLGLVHQDVSPENLLVGFDGVTRVTDFGVAHVSAPWGVSAELRGRPQYLAPERITSGEVDHRADIFALGVVLYRLLTGLDLFEGDTVEDVLSEILYKPIPLPSTVGRRPHPAFDPVCLRALERERDLRYQSAEHFRAELLRTAVLVDQLALASDVADLARLAAEAAHPELHRPKPGTGAPEDVPLHAAAPGARAIVLVRQRSSEAAKLPTQQTQVLAPPRKAEPLPMWVVALFLALSLGLALLLDALSDSGSAPPDLPVDEAQQPRRDVPEIRIDLEDDEDGGP